jgi:toxin ParE1/3/4
MAVHLTWSLLAENDLRDLVTYIRAANPLAAESFAASLIEQIELLADFPELGRMVPERNDPAIREMIYRRYRIIYRFPREKTKVEIIRLWHAARDTPDLPSTP